MKILVSHIGRIPPPVLLPASLVRRIARVVLRRERIKVLGELSIVLIDEKNMRRLNQKFHGKKNLTDVLAFSYVDKKAASKDRPWGDIFICPPVAYRNAKLFHETGRMELIRLVVHGLLHLIGYRDTGEREK